MAIQATGILLEGCVLSLLAREDAYGYSLTQQMKSTLGVSESTLYPVMRRLQTDDCLTVYDMPHNGRNRRYYKITKRGLARYWECKAAWADFKQRIDTVLSGQNESIIDVEGSLLK
ncbi:MAG: PadR family transcriptional regulator [Defluviitaleaceae bacterium]|nr:PadR family transcriptional regulator [Defluviitaleaceae bacterium]